MIEKLVILTHMFSRECQQFMNYGLGDELMSHMWNGHFRSEGNNVANDFARVNQAYRDKLRNFWFGELERVKY